MKTIGTVSEIKEFKKSVDYVDGKRVVEWVYMVTRDCKTFSTREEAKKHLRYLKDKQARQWKKVTQAYMEDKIDWIILPEHDYHFTVVTNLETNEKGWCKLEGTKPYQRKEAIIKAFKELNIKD
jgi:6-phosphogluconate dehydrogenase (decarboxylating)